MTFDMKARFEPDPFGPPGRVPDPLAGTRQANPASENKVAPEDDRNEASKRRFVVDSDGGLLARPASRPDSIFPEPANDLPAISTANSDQPQNPDPPAPTSDAWRHELAAKLDHYRRHKRVRMPRYPSLQLKFDDTAWSKGTTAHPSDPPPSRLAVAMQEFIPEPAPAQVEEPEIQEAVSPPSRKILEFPRFFATPQPTFNDLAEPVLVRPRILDVPEQLPPPPALGGISIETQEESAVERRPGFELPLNPPSPSRRLAAGAIDAALVLTAFGAFAYVFFRMTATLPVAKESALVAAALIACFWVGYQYLFLVHSGATPGLRLAHLRLSRFDGQPVPRRVRRWRVLASALSGFSLGLGYAWCILDEDQLCWHDRITHTYMAIDSSRQSEPA